MSFRVASSRLTRRPTKLAQRRDRSISYSTRVHAGKEVHVGVEVEGEAVHGHLPRHSHPDRGDLPLLGPDPGKPFLAPALLPQSPQRVSMRTCSSLRT